jgi:PAS domain S-box-containing protein
LFLSSAIFSASTIALWAVSNYIIPNTSDGLVVPIIVAVFATISLLVSIVFLLIKKSKSSPVFAIVDYLSIFITMSILVYNTNLVHSPFIGLFGLVCLFASLYGLWGILPALAANGALLADAYLNSDLNFETTATVIAIGILPLIIGIYIWHVNKNEAEDTGPSEHNLRLNSQLDKISNQSEVIIGAIGDGVLALDSKGNIMLINPAAERITGWSTSDSLKLNYKSVLQLVDSKGQPVNESSDPVLVVLNNNEQVRNDDLELMTKNSKKIMVSLLISPVGAMGSGVIVVFRDITKEKAEEKEQAEFISTASHEMRTPVTAIEGYLGLALNPQTATIDEKARAFITKAHESTQHLGRLFKDLLDVSRADDKRLNSKPKVTNIMILVEDIVNGLKPQANQKNLGLIFLPKPDDSGRFVVPVYYVNLDPDFITEILGNLVENAIKYTNEGKVSVDVKASDDNIKISVEDTGIGISEEDIPHLFQKFYRVNNAETNQIGGSGLGLYLSRKLVDSLGGQIWIESTYHKGSIFHLQLPRISNEEAKALSEVQSREIGAAKTKPQTLQDVLPPRPQTPADGLSRKQMQQDNTNSTKSVKPATAVPRGESLTREQILEKAKMLHEMAQSQSKPGAEITTTKPQASTTPVQKNPSVINSRIGNIRIPERH